MGKRKVDLLTEHLGADTQPNRAAFLHLCLQLSLKSIVMLYSKVTYLIVDILQTFPVVLCHQVTLPLRPELSALGIQPVFEVGTESCIGLHNFETTFQMPFDVHSSDLQDTSWHKSEIHQPNQIDFSMVRKECLGEE